MCGIANIIEFILEDYFIQKVKDNFIENRHRYLPYTNIITSDIFKIS